MRVKRVLDHSCYQFLESNYPPTISRYPFLLFVCIL